ncbi:MAG TPA: hypothetical protein VNZ57_12955 [Longimicrobiales bacterium]|nr:hypothetical protein [Longimicrobiales bacterium]
MSPDRPLIPIRFDMSAMVRRQVASLYSHLVTRPTGRALRLGIQSQIGELGSVCLSILDFEQVVVLDYSCADEAVAKLIQHYVGPERSAEAYFVAQGVDEHHRETIEAVLFRHGLALVADVHGQGFTVLGELGEDRRMAWHALHELGEAEPAQVARAADLKFDWCASALEDLAARRLVARVPGSPRYLALSALVRFHTDR